MAHHRKYRTRHDLGCVYRTAKWWFTRRMISVQHALRGCMHRNLSLNVLVPVRAIGRNGVAHARRKLTGIIIQAQNPPRYIAMTCPACSSTLLIMGIVNTFNECPSYRITRRH
ncbi:unnamed protein product [Ectocarpus sp. 4 AP-2014]